MMHITDSGLVKSGDGCVVGHVAKAVDGDAMFFPSGHVYFYADDLEEIARLMRGDDAGGDDLEHIVQLMRGDDEWIEQEIFTIEEAGGLVGRQVRIRAGTQISVMEIKIEVGDARYSDVIDDLRRTFYVNHTSRCANTQWDIVAYRGPKL